ncbi:MAG: D-alanyl-D-alanine carboxypeptidase family protein [Defluviitaleaceae bacterium]|nr:D-alanyl-D-alanine carboxypeptidase family protein [Defluviitaleaceae bacterium]
MNPNTNRKQKRARLRTLPKVIIATLILLTAYFIWSLITNGSPEILTAASEAVSTSIRNNIRARSTSNTTPNPTPQTNPQLTSQLTPEQTPSPYSESQTPNSESQTPNSESPSSTLQPPLLSYSEFRITNPLISLNEITPTPYLKLVNRTLSIQNPINADYLVNVWPDSPARDSSVLLHATASAAIRDLLAEARNTGFSGLYVADGYRTHNEQAHLFANIADKTYVMPAGHSEHQLGLAADILSVDGNFNGMRGTAEAQWLAENAPRFGLILRYPYDKQDITQVAYEPWHFRYVGRVHAFIMGEYGFVLEEYIEFLRERETYEAEIDGKTYLIIYQRPENGKISVPEHWVHTVSDAIEGTFTVSDANTGGYIVTVWR